MRVSVSIVRYASLGALGMACSTGCNAGDAGSVTGDPVRVAPTLTFPRGLLDNVASLAIDVFDKTDTLDCDAATGTATAVTSDTPRVVSATLGTSCTGTARFCGSVTIQKGKGARVFWARGLAQSGDAIANGCAVATIDQDSVALPIRMVRNVPPSTCGDGTVGATEQCEPPGNANDPLCDAQCHTKEQTLSTGVPKATGPVSLVWPAQSGNAGRFFALFASNGANSDVALRVMSDTLTPVTSPAALRQAVLLPSDPNQFPPPSLIGNQSQPAAVFANSVYWVAFTDDAAGDPDIHLRSFDVALAAEQGPGETIGVNGANGGGEPNAQSAPSIALGSGGRLLIAWEDDTGPTAGHVLARVYDPKTKQLGTQNQISTGTQNRNVKIAATATGWLAVWESGGDVKLRVIDGNGTPSGPEQTVNDASAHRGAQDRPSVAVLPDGRACVAWTDNGASGGADVFVQRFDADLARIAGDQTTPINDVVTAGDQVSPSVAATPAAGGAFLVAWVDASSGHVRARYLGPSGGGLPNNVTGQLGEFQASTVANHLRATPAIIAGGTGHVAIAWEDRTAGAIVTRRFPLPTP